MKYKSVCKLVIVDQALVFFDRFSGGTSLVC